MGLSLREWLIIGGAIIVALIVLDGWRRMRGSRNTLKMHIDESLVDAPEEVHNPELPGGGFRVIEPDGQVTTVASRKEPEFKTELKPEFKTDPQPESLVADTATGNSASMHAEPEWRTEPEFRPAGGFDSVDQQEERDPLFEPLEDFSNYSEGVSAVRIIPTPDAQKTAVSEIESETVAATDLAIEQSDKISTEETFPTKGLLSTEENISADSVADSLFDLPDISDTTPQSEQPESIKAEDDIENNQAIVGEAPLSATEINDDSDNEFIATRLDNIDDDDLIASLPDDFSVFHDEVAEQEDIADSDLDLSKPVIELMRKAQNEQAEPLQESMELVAESRQASESYSDPVSKQYATSVPVVAEGFNREKTDPLLGGCEQETAVDTFTSGRSLQDIPEPGNVLVISVVAPKSQPSFYGSNLLQILLACGMRFGDMQIFHRCEDGIDQGAIQFSMANAHEPGYFDIDKMDAFETRGVTFFMSMDEPRDVMNAYECMLATAEAVAKNLEGELLDENHSTMRTQTKEHYRERIRKFEMRKLKQQH